MGQVNVNTPGGGAAPGEPAGSSGAGLILGVILAIVLIIVLLWIFVLQPQPATDGGETDGGDAPAPSALVLTRA